MSATTLMVAQLKATAGVTAIVGAKVYPMIAPQSAALPYIIYEKPLDVPVNTATGADATSQKRFAVSCFAATYSGAHALGAAVAAALSGWVDSAGCVWHQESCTDDMGEVMSGQDVPEYYAVNQEYTVWV